MLKIEWRHYQILLAIRDNGSLTAAAKSVGLTQPAASHQVKEAERRLGVSLVTRRGRHLQLTDAGETIADTASQCAPLMLQAENKARDVSFGAVRRLRIAYGPQDSLPWAVDVANYLGSLDQPMSLDLIAANDVSPTQALRQNQAEFAVEIGVASFVDLKRVHLGDDELVCLLAENHRLARKTEITASDVTGETYFAHSLVPLPGFELEAVFQPAGQHPAHVAQVQSMAAIKSMTAAGLGISFQPYSMLLNDLKNSNLTALPLAPKKIKQPWHLHATGDFHLQYGAQILTSMAQIMARHIVSLAA